MKIRLTLPAARQLDRVLEYIAARNPQGAGRLNARLSAMMNMLLLHPAAGYETARQGERRILVTPYPYAITYRIGDEEIIILGIRHTARRPQ